MKQDQAQLLSDALYDEGYDASINDDYSGRGMYGKTTYAVTSDAAPDDVAYACGKADLSRPQSDNMGLDFVYY